MGRTNYPCKTKPDDNFDFRVIEGDNIYVVALNYGDTEVTVDLTHFPFIDEDTKLTVEVKSVGSKLKEEGSVISIQD